MHPVTMQLGTKKGIIERKRHIEVTRAMGKYLWRANSCDGRTVDASSSCNVANAGRHEEEKAASASSTDPILSQPTAQLTSVLI